MLPVVIALGLSVAALLAAVPAGAQAPVCPITALAEPQMEGVEQRVIVGQPQPCPPGGAREDWDVRVAFGDGAEAATRFEPGDELWFVAARHAYRRAGRYTLVGTMTHRGTGETRVLRREIDVPNAPLDERLTARPAFAAERRARRVVARFADGNRLASPADHRATIAWGDGTRSRGRVRRDAAGRFRVEGAHRYRSVPRSRIAVTIRDDRGAELVVRVAPRVR